MNQLDYLMSVFTTKENLTKAAKRDVSAFYRWRNDGFIPILALIEISKTAKRRNINIDFNKMF